jgi:hypothetical protein
MTTVIRRTGWLARPDLAADKAYAEADIPPIRLFKFVSPGLMKTVGGTLIAGRDFTWTDAYETRMVAMVSENLARELWQSPGAALGSAFARISRANGVKSSASSATSARMA